MAQDIVHADDVIIEGSACVSDDNACASGESFPSNADIKIKDALPRLLFEDSSASSSPDRHYRIAIGDAGTTGAEYFAIEDAGASGTAATQVFRVDGGAPANALHVDSTGEVGIGTATPGFDVHVVTGNTPGLRLEQDGSSSFTPQTWDIYGNEGIFEIKDATHGNRRPFRIQPNADDTSLYIATGSRIGFGTSGPQADLHLRRNSSAAVARVENLMASTARLDLKSPNAEWRFSNQNGPFAIREDGDPVNELTLNKAGDLIITGTLTTAGSCAVGCDAVYDPGYAIESIEEHASRMWEERHLPAVGPTAEGQSMNLSEKVGGIINELEKAHIYIDQLNERLSERERQYSELREEIQDRDKQIADFRQRMARVEALLPRSR